MSQPFDIRQFPGLPPEVVKAFEAQQFELAVEGEHRKVWGSQIFSAIAQPISKITEALRTAVIRRFKIVAPHFTVLSDYPTSKQVSFAERLARAKRRSVPDECFRSRELMSRWIDSNRF
ncbi:MAG: hypothetical protein JJU08_14340 [Rhodobacteraceae bacterium]|nr:hypothetical protein [Paracoccaceae bacterium]